MKPVSIDEFCNFTFLSNVTFSPDGKAMAFVASKADKEQNKYTSHIYVRKDGRIFRLTGGGKEGKFRFLDSETILFAGNREESTEPSLNTFYYTISLNGGEAEKYLTLPITATNVIPLKNGDCIVEGITVPGFENLYTGDTKLAEKCLKEAKENEDYQVIIQNPWWWNGSTYIQGKYSSIFYYNKKKQVLTRLTETGYEASMAKVSEDERYIFYCEKELKPRDLREDLSFVRMELKTRERKVILAPSRDYILHGYDLGKDFMVAAIARTTHGLNTNPDFFKIDYETLEMSEYAHWSETIGSSVGSDIRYGGGRAMKMDGNICYFIATICDSAYLYKLKDGRIERVIDKEGSVDCFDVHDGNLIFCALWDMKGAEIYDAKCKPLTDFNKQVLKNKYLAIPEKFTFMTGGVEEGFSAPLHEIHGFVLKPFGFRENQTYPVIFDIHGGPKTVFGEVYYHEMQYWAGKGYFVIYCNPTGSDGRGNEFMDIRGKYGTVDYEDLMAFVDEALKRYPQMDPTHVYETGGSYGGFMTNWIIGHTDRFRACASQRSISNWFSFYGVSDIGVDFALDQCASDIWKDSEKLWWHSPLKYADQVKTPTLFIHSENDYRCPIDQGYQMFTALLTHGVESRLVQFKGENHDLSRTGKPKHRIKRLQEITDWFMSH